MKDFVRVIFYKGDSMFGRSGFWIIRDGWTSAVPIDKKLADDRICSAIATATGHPCRFAHPESSIATQLRLAGLLRDSE